LLANQQAPILFELKQSKEITMIGYTTVGTDNLNQSGAFYDALLKLMNAKRVMQEDDFIAWSNGSDGAMFSIHLPADGNKTTIGNGVMIALKAKNVEHVKTLYQKVLSLGGSSEGEPGFRVEGFYAAYFRDLNGNKLNVHCMVSA